MDEQAIVLIVEENRRLKQGLAELEKQLRQAKAEADSLRGMGKLLTLIKQRDLTLEEISGELQNKKHELETAVDKLKERNEQLQVWVSTLTLYQQLLESDPDAIIGISREGTLILYNEVATKLFGEEIRQWRMKPIEEIDFSALDPAIPSFVRDVLRSGASSSRAATIGSRTVTATAHVMGSHAQPRGALVRITIAAAK